MPSSDMDIERPISRETILTENTDDFIIGDRVWVHGTKPGYIQYLGETQFSPGIDWAGVVLDDNSGKNDGSVAGVRYFQCEAKRGVFARLHKLTRYPLLHVTPSTPSPTPPPLHRCITPTRTPSPGARNLREGDRVTISSSTGPNKTGVLRFLGHTDFATGEWAGVELDEPIGKNDGTVAGKRYFRCPSNYGLFSLSHKVTKVTGSLDRHRRTAHGTNTEKENPVNGSTQSLHVEGNGKRFPEESEKRAQRLRQLLETAEAERRDLATKLEAERKKIEELEFRIEEECITKDDIETEKEIQRQKIDDLERRLEQETRKNDMVNRGVTPDSILKDESKRLNEEVKSLQEKLRQSEVKIQELQKVKKEIPVPTTSLHTNRAKSDELMRKEEALIQSQLSLDNKKREVQNLLNRLQEQEKELEKSKARQTRQLDIIDDLNMKLQKSENKSISFADEIHSANEKHEELERRLKSATEQLSQLDSQKKRLSAQLLSPEPTSKEQTLLTSLKEREDEVSECRRLLDAAQKEVDQLKKTKEQQRREVEKRIHKIQEECQEQMKQEKKKATESEDFNVSRIRELERILTSAKDELESARLEAEARLSRQEARLQEAELKTENLDRLREQISRLQAEKDLLRVEKEETLKRLQFAEQSRGRWESEANRASEEVNLLKSQVQSLRTEFTHYREDLVKQLEQTELDNREVQDLHLQIEEQRIIVDQMQQRLKWSEGERDQLQTQLSTRKQDQLQAENGLRKEVETLRRR